ncbi:hypothetical protein PHBOTO_000027 [Pseudozyma hubeiensis]|nr:hypothetical protein PHBOTO_000027 [Pseudozyma hubeiensis]
MASTAFSVLLAQIHTLSPFRTIVQLCIMSSSVTIKCDWNMALVKNGSFTADNSRSVSSITIAPSSGNACKVTITNNTGESFIFKGVIQTSSGSICDTGCSTSVQISTLEDEGKSAELEKFLLTTYHNVPQLRLKRFEASAEDIPYLRSIEHGVYTLIGKTCNVRVDWFVPEKYFTAVMGRAFDLMGFTLFQRPETVRAGLMDEIEYVREQMRKGVVYPIDDEDI